MGTDIDTKGLALVELGDSGLQRSGGYILDEFLPALQGLRGRKIYREMADNDPVIGGMLFAIEHLVRSVSWSVQAGDDSPEAQRNAEFIETCMADMSHSFGDLIAEALTMLVYGWSYHELVYKIRAGDQSDPRFRSRHVDGLVGWRKIPGRSQDTLDRWDLDDAGGVRAMVQYPPFGSVRTIPIEKALLFRTTKTRDNPEGRSTLRSAYRSWYLKKRIEKVEAIGIERDLAGIPLIRVPAEMLSESASAEQKRTLDAFKRLGRNLRNDEQAAVVFPEARDDRGERLYDIELLGRGGTSKQFDTSKVIDRYNRLIAMTVLADFILLGHEKVGSFALSSDKTHLFATALGSFVGVIRDTMNQYAIPRLFALNPMLPGPQPKFVTGDIETPNLQELGAYVASLAGAGMDLFPDDALEGALRRAGNLPEKSRGA